jgi:hypothetical protein
MFNISGMMSTEQQNMEFIAKIQSSDDEKNRYTDKQHILKKLNICINIFFLLPQDKAHL